MKHIPNILSAFRIVLLPFFVWQMLVGKVWNAGFILAISGASDFFDGLLARRFGWVTNLGKVLDPIADKLTQGVVSLTLMFQLREYWYFFAFMILKDFIMMVLGGYLLTKGVKLEGARWFGKVSTFVYYLVMILLVFVPDMPRTIVITLLSIATLCAMIVAFLYIPEFLRYKNSADPNKLSNSGNRNTQDT